MPRHDHATIRPPERFERLLWAIWTGQGQSGLLCDDTAIMREAFCGMSRIRAGQNKHQHGRARQCAPLWLWEGSNPLLHLALSAAARHGPSTRCAAPHQWTEPRGAIGLALLGGPPEPPPATLTTTTSQCQERGALASRRSERASALHRRGVRELHAT